MVNQTEIRVIGKHASDSNFAPETFIYIYITMSRPYIICHMVSSVDGRIDCEMTEQIEPGDEYYDILGRIDCPSLLMGRVTMQLHYASSEPFIASDPTPIGHERCHTAAKSGHYTIGIDSTGRLRWPSNEFDGALIIITSQDAPAEYLDTLTAQGISWIATGYGSIDLCRAMELLRENFGVERLALTGGGHINAAFLKAGLIDEFSILIAPGIDGRALMACSFDGLDNRSGSPFPLKLMAVEQPGNGMVWLRYLPVKQ